jgi:hypothetical protein
MERHLLFIEDEIDNSKDITYLKRVTLKLAENHLKDIFKLSPYASCKKYQLLVQGSEKTNRFRTKE